MKQDLLARIENLDLPALASAGKRPVCKCHGARMWRSGTRDGRPCWICAVKKSESKRRWRENNPDKVRKTNERYLEANREKISERRRQYRIKNIDKVRERERESSRRQREINPEKVRERQRRWEEANAEKERERKHNWYENLSGYEYNLMLLKERRRKALTRMAQREARRKESEWPATDIKMRQISSGTVSEDK